ncbi:MAG: CBS domain-containing protein [Chromatiaceae bacterium]|nr:CBS domain-containing protein [Gammaproteobacteria bacterium]MCB1881822.1 CBS domain-containing protein [Gammaproteobacteria bacterium]MCP5447060.1 CBS domain-containing protein [Chromatiaceae bacterium]
MCAQRIWLNASIRCLASSNRVLHSAIQLERCGLVVVRDGRPVGIFSERDYARNIILNGRTSRETLLADAMSSPVVVAHPDQSVDECMAVMTEMRVRHLPVIKNDQLVGIVSIGDLVKAVIENQQFMIEQLVSYINS